MSGTIDYGNNVKPICHNQCSLEHCEIGDLTHVKRSRSNRLTMDMDQSDTRNCEEIMKGIYGNFINGKLISHKRKPCYIFLITCQLLSVP